MRSNGRRAAGKVFDVVEIEQQLAAADFVHQAEKLLADDLDILLVKDLAIDKVDHGDIADVFNFEPTPTGLR